MSEIVKSNKHGTKIYKDEEALKEGQWYEWRSNTRYVPMWMWPLEHLLIVPLSYLIFKLMEFKDWQKLKQKKHKNPHKS